MYAHEQLIYYIYIHIPQPPSTATASIRKLLLLSTIPSYPRDPFPRFPLALVIQETCPLNLENYPVFEVVPDDQECPRVC